MRDFIYKTIIAGIFFIIIFEFTIGKRIDPISQNINKFSNGENRLSVINLLLNNNFSCYLVSNFRNSQKQKNNIVKQDPIKKIEINKDNLNSMLFDRGNLDQLIIASKNDININFLNCFKL